MNETPDNLPPNMKQLIISAGMMDYLAEYWEIRDHGELFSWSIRLLHDLTKMDEAGWRLTLSKAELDEDTKSIKWNANYRQLVFMLKWLAPTAKSYPRLPDVETLERTTKMEKA